MSVRDEEKKIEVSTRKMMLCKIDDLSRRLEESVRELQQARYRILKEISELENQ